MQLETTLLEGGIKQIKLIGRLDVKGAGEINDAFLIQAATKKAGLLVDMAEVNFIASLGVRMLLSSAKALVRRGGKMILLNPTPLVNEVLTTSGVDDLIPVSHDFAAACEDLKAAVSE